MIGFNLTGWIWKSTRNLHLAVVALTLLSWIGLGAIYGWGYCFLTDWQWEIKRSLGEQDLPNSFVKYFADKVFATSFDPGLIDLLTVIMFAMAIVATIIVQVRSRSFRN